MSTTRSDDEQFSDRDLGSTVDITSRDGLNDSVDVTGAETYSSIEDQAGTFDQVQVDGDVLVAQPPKERDGSDYHAVAISGTSALDILDQVRGFVVVAFFFSFG